MIYDKPVSLLSMPDTTGIPSPGCLVPVFDAWCAEKTVYAKRFWEAVANGSRVDKLVELPLHRTSPPRAMPGWAATPTGWSRPRPGRTATACLSRG